MKKDQVEIAHRLEEAARRSLASGDEAVVDVRIGLRYVAVALACGTGVAFSAADGPARGCALFNGSRPLAGKAAGDLLSLLPSMDPVEVAVGLAAANAAANRLQPEWIEGDVLEVVRLGAKDDVAMVGHFGPLVAPLRARVRSLRILERVKHAQGDLLPVQEAPGVIRSSHVALITSSSITNHGLDELLLAAENCREVVLLGASTPLLPEAFEDTAVTCLSGIVVEKAADVLCVVSEAGGMRQFSPFVRKVNVPLRRG